MLQFANFVDAILLLHSNVLLSTGHFLHQLSLLEYYRKSEKNRCFPSGYLFDINFNGFVNRFRVNPFQLSENAIEEIGESRQFFRKIATL
jgi:hypothetical protein